MPARPWRPFTRWVLAPPYPGPTFEFFSEPATPDFMWELIGLESDIPERGRSLFTGNYSHRNALFREFRSYIRQAKEYDIAAKGVAATSAGLLHYYTAMNLAKAELLRTTPNPVTGLKITHGLSYSPTAARTIAGDRLRVNDGIFPLLYRKR